MPTDEQIIRAAIKKELEKADSSESRQSQPLLALEAKAAEEERLRIENDRLREEVNRKVSDRELRGEYSNKVFGFLIAYCSVIGVFVILDSIGIWNIEVPVLTVLSGSTAVAAIGLVGFVVNGLFKDG